MLQTLLQNPYVALVGYLAGILGTVVSVLAIRRKRLCYTTSSFPLVSPRAVPGLRVSFGDKSIEKLNGALVTLWNRGSAVVHWKDVAPAAPLTVTLEGHGEILEIRCENQSKPGNNFAVNEAVNDANSYILSFDYIGPNDGCKLSILHTGESDQLSIKGELIGAPAIRRAVFNPNRLLLFAFIGLGTGTGMTISYLVSIIKAGTAIKAGDGGAAADYINKTEIFQVCAWVTSIFTVTCLAAGAVYFRRNQGPKMQDKPNVAPAIVAA
jgi:hypothetical protein